MQPYFPEWVITPASVVRGGPGLQHTAHHQPLDDPVTSQTNQSHLPVRTNDQLLIRPTTTVVGSTRQSVAEPPEQLLDQPDSERPVSPAAAVHQSAIEPTSNE